MIFVTHFGSSQAAKDYLTRHLSTGDYFAKDAEQLSPTYDVPKGVSVAGLVEPRVNAAIDSAVDETMREIEKDAKTRVRKGGKDEDRSTGNMLWAVWSHDTTRPLEDGTVDVHQHRHVTV